MKSNDVFISYSSKNYDIASRVKKQLQSHGISCWMAPESISSGSNYTKEIPIGIKYSKLAVLVLSNDAVDSIWVNYEITYLIDLGRPIIPFVTDDLCIDERFDDLPFSKIVQSDLDIKQFSKFDLLDVLLWKVEHLLGRESSVVLTDSSDDLLQLGLKNIGEDGGMLYDKGYAEYYLKKAALMGNAVAMRHLALLMFDVEDEVVSKSWWNKAAKKRDIPSIIHIANDLWHSGDSHNLSKAVQLLEYVSQKKDPEGCCLYAEILLEHNQFHDSQKALELLHIAHDKNYKHAACILGNMYRTANGVEENPQKAFQYYKEAAKSSVEREACLRLADCYFQGYGTLQNYKLAFRGYAANCYYSAEYMEKYADCFLYGYGTKVDRRKALEQYRHIPISGGFDDSSNELEMRVLRKMLELGDSDSALVLAQKYYYKGNYKKAYGLFKDAADKNNAIASMWLAICLLYGKGVECNYKQAFRLFSKAYSMKCQNAAIYLSQCYYLGIGTMVNMQFADYFKNVSTQECDGLWKISFLD